MKNIFFFALTLFLFTSCKKDIDALPEATQTGANTFGAKLNGEFWGPQKGIINNVPIVEARYTGTGGVFINARNFKSSPTETEFEIYIASISAPATFLLNQNTDIYPNQNASYGYYIKRKIIPEGEWITSSLHTGSVTITRYDTANKIISGTFEFTAGSIDNSADAITVTEGRFDVKVQ
jgi:hypothetical protein